MNAIVIIEKTDGKIKKPTLEAVAYARALQKKVIVIALGEVSVEASKTLGNYGAETVWQIPLASPPTSDQYCQIIALAFEKFEADTLILSQVTDIVTAAAKVAAQYSISFTSHVVELPDMQATTWTVKKSIYSGKAFEYVTMNQPKRIIVINKNTIEPKPIRLTPQLHTWDVDLAHPSPSIKRISVEKTTQKVSLSDADIVVSGGRGLKGPEHWGMLEELARALGAAMACSKPVSDMGWRPHHEHVGQTGIKVSPQLYIAVGISGAIQHLAGVNSSKCILVINTDANAPFFKIADYGVIGDAFEVIPNLIEALKN